jgi:transcriptional regulator with XRE-family HTH domain
MNTTEKMLEVGAKIKKLRDLKGLTQTEMAEKLHLSLNAYGKVEREETELSISRLQEIAKILEVTIYELLDFDEKKLIFNQTQSNNDNATAIAYQEANPNFEGERKQYEARITDLKQENQRLHALLEKSLNK